MYDRNLSEDEKIKEKIMRTLKIKICKTDIEKQKKENIWKIIIIIEEKIC